MQRNIYEKLLKNPSYVSGQSTIVLMEIELQFFIYTLMFVFRS